MQDNPLVHWTPVHFSHRQSRYNLAVKKSGLESSGVHMEYGGDCKDLFFIYHSVHLVNTILMHLTLNNVVLT